jgi:hypothetical protein
MYSHCKLFVAKVVKLEPKISAKQFNKSELAIRCKILAQEIDLAQPISTAL